MSYGTRLLVLTKLTQVSILTFNFPFKQVKKKISQHSNYQAFLFIKGKIHEDYLREILTTFGDRFTDDQVDDMYKEAPIK